MIWTGEDTEIGYKSSRTGAWLDEDNMSIEEVGKVLMYSIITSPMGRVIPVEYEDE